MKKIVRITTILNCFILLAFAMGPGPALSAADSPIDPCLDCHTKETAKIVKQWEAGKHSKTGVKCYVCHFAEQDDPQGMEHNGYFVITEVSKAACESCHPENGAELHQQFSRENAAHP